MMFTEGTHGMTDMFHVDLQWHEDERVWFVKDTDVPGLHAEAATLADMQAVLRDLIPQLVDLDGDLDLEVEVRTSAPLAASVA